MKKDYIVPSATIFVTQEEFCIDSDISGYSNLKIVEDAMMEE